MKITPTIRQATLNDHQDMMIYALKLLRQHQNFNPMRFVQFENHEERLFAFFKAEIINPKAIVLIVELEQEIVGYAFVRIEESSLAAISPEAAWLHDIFIDEKARGFGAGKLLLAAAIASAQKLGANRMMLQVAAQNEFAKKLFELNGFQVSTYEMIKDIS